MRSNSSLPMMSGGSGSRWAPASTPVSSCTWLRDASSPMRTTATNLRWPVRATPGYHGGPLACQAVRTLAWSLEEKEEDSTLVLLGQLDFGPQGPTNVRLEHRFTLSSTGRGSRTIVPTAPSRP